MRTPSSLEYCGCFLGWMLSLSSFFFGCIGSSLLRAGFSVVAASGCYSSLRCVGFSLWCVGFSLQWLLLLRSTGSRHGASVVVALERRLSSCGARA